MNIPYKKKYDGNGICTNPITKNNPYISKTFLGINEKGIPMYYPNRSERKMMTKNRKSKTDN